MEEIKKQLTPYFSFIYIFCFLIVFIIMAFESLLKPEIFLGYNLDLISNDYCQKYNKSMNDLEKLACNNTYKKSKIIWLQLDGLAIDLLHEIIKLDKYKIVHFKTVQLTGYKKSPRCHEMHFTGHSSRNVFGFKVNRDNLLVQMKNVGINLHYMGESNPIYQLFSHLNVFESSEIFQNSFEKFPMSRICNNVDLPNYHSKELNESLAKFSDNFGYIKDEYRKDNNSFILYDEIEKVINKDLINISKCDEFNKIINEDKNLFFYLTLVDDNNHNYFKHYYLNTQHLFMVENILLKFMEFVDTHPEYILISGSDHGGQSYYGEDNYINHGKNEYNNYPFHFLYTKELKEKYSEWKKGIQNMTIEKIAVTISQLITGINLPLESTDFPLIIGNDTIFRIAACKSKEFQLRSFMEKYLEKYPTNKNLFDKIITKLNNSEYVKNIDKSLYDEDYKEKYYEFLKEIQKDILNEAYNSQKDGFQRIFITIIFLFMICFIIYNISNFYKKYFEKQNYNFSNIMFIFFMLFFLNFENFFIVFYNNDSLYILSKYRIINYILIAIFLMFVIIKEKINYKDNLFYYFLHIILIIISSYFIKKYDLFIQMKKFFNYKPYNKIVDLTISIPLSFVLTNITIFQFKSYYFKNKSDKNIFSLFAILNMIIHILIFIYDLNSSVILKYPSINIVCGIIIPLFLLIFSFFILFLFSYYLKLNINFLNENETLYKKEYLFPLLKLSYYYYHFYLSDMNEKFFLVIFIIPFLEFTVYLYNKNVEEKLRKYKIFYILMLIIHIDLCFILFQKYYSFDVTLLETLNKSIGVINSKKHTVIGGIIVGLHILKYYLLLVHYLISLFKLDTNKFINKDTNIIFIFLKIQVCFIIAILLLLINKKGIENDDVMEYFIWAVGKLSVFLFCDLYILSIICFSNLKNKKNTKLDSKIEGLISNENFDASDNNKQYLILNNM